MQLKLNVDINTVKGKKKKGDIIELKADENNIPLDRFWRDRLKDSKIDKCVEIVIKKSKK